ncbi:MAG: 23S rRNA (adenine(2503)-C(2))-methyltransferase RlmN [Thiomargarita sp.]|nr:23S rRNA (adenine(2503)-C(2))-methyltransferase RlmN [Thiomargarita sp.]
MINLLDMDQTALSEFFAEIGEKPFRATQVMKWIHQLGVLDFDMMSNLSKALRQKLKAVAYISIPKVILHQLSEDGTHKWLLQLDEQNSVEMVLIPEEERHTLCISSQVGCALDCQFCATAKQGFNRNLTTGEIIAQLWLAEHVLFSGMNQDEEFIPVAKKQRTITNVVMMGMGEPLTNFNNVIKAMRIMLDDFAYGLSWRRITLSTVGIIPAINRLKTECPVSFAISLHAPNDDLRNKLVPINKKYPIKPLIAACHDYIKGEQHRRHITFEYVMLKGVNDDPNQAKQLVKLLRNLPAKINLIPFNQFSQSDYQCSSQDKIDQFRNILLQGGLVTVTRKTRGNDIDAACGQLAGKVLNKKKNLTNTL